MNMRTEIKFGIYLGLALCLYTIFLWLTKLDTTYLATGQYLDIAVILLPIIFTFLAISQKSKKTNLTFFKRILTGVMVNFVAFLIYNPFLIIYHRFLNPDWLKYVLELKEKELLAQNVAPDKIKNTLELIANSSNDLSHIISGFIVGVIIFGIVFSLLTIPFIRSKSELTS
jgi:hypothetical protein